MTLRVALLGYSHEVNSLAPVTRLEQGHDARSHPGGLAEAWESAAFVRRFRELRDVDFVELPVWEIPPGGPMDAGDFAGFLGDIDRGLRNSGPFDAVAIFGHGAGTTTTNADADGTYMRLIRDIVGPGVPMVAILDFHANVSAAMLESCDACIGYLTNPHVDIADRLIEMAELMDRLLDGERFVRAWVHLPLIAAQIGLLTDPSEPMGRVLGEAQSWRTPQHLNVSVYGGFSLADTPDCGMSVVVTALREHQLEAAELARRIADRLWAMRAEFRFRTTSVADAIDAICAQDRRFILADVADNPGGGGSGSTIHMLEAVRATGVEGVQIGVIRDSLVVADAWSAGVGAKFTAEFNRATDDPFAHRGSFDARVVALGEGWFTPRTGMMSGASLNLGRTCALDIDGVLVGISERPFQVTDPDVLRHTGLTPESARVIVLKSRGHFRAGFTEDFGDHQIIEVGAPGLATNDLESVPWRRLPRPVFPLDRYVSWTADTCEVFA